MRILVLNGSPRPKGNTAKMVDAFRRGAEEAGHEVDIFNVAHMNIHGCNACEYCHGKGHGACVQQDDMQRIYPVLQETDMLVLASPIYYHGFSSQLKSAIDRFYASAYPQGPTSLRKASIILSSGAPGVYCGALFSYHGDFLDYLGLEDMGIFTAHGAENGSQAKLDELYKFGKSL